MKVKPLFLVLGTVFIFCLCFAAVVLVAKFANRKEAGSQEMDAYMITAPNAEEFYECNAIVISSINTKASTTTLSEAEVSALLINRGFTQFPATSSYSMDGEYYSSKEVSPSSSKSHPMYETFFITEIGEVWSIFVINGVIIANPTSFNLQSGLQVNVMISETDTIMSYDRTTNKFYETIPNQDALCVITVDRINAKTLASLTIEVLDSYV